MNDAPTTEPGADPLERALDEELMRGDAIIGASRPILRHLLANEDYTLFSEEMVAHVRGMMFDLAWQLLWGWAGAAGIADKTSFVQARQGGLAQLLFHDQPLIGHAHALATEGQVAERLQREGGIDAVLSPLVQDLAASGDPAVADLAMALLAAQARFMQAQRRMELPLAELPGDLFHKALVQLRTFLGDSELAAEEPERNMRSGYEEGVGRLALLARLAAGVLPDTGQALALDQAGVAIFATALAMASGQDREMAVLSFAEQQFSRLALGLRSAGLSQEMIARQFLLIHPDIALPGGFDSIAPTRALELLGGSRAAMALQP
jgi:hypothetical protein